MQIDIQYVCRIKSPSKQLVFSKATINRNNIVARLVAYLIVYKTRCSKDNMKQELRSRSTSLSRFPGYHVDTCNMKH